MRARILGVVVAVLLIGTGLAVVWLIWRSVRNRRSEDAEPLISPTPPIEQEISADAEPELVEMELKLVQDSLLKHDGVDLGIHYDALGSLLSSAPTADTMNKLRDLVLVAMVARNSLWGLTQRVPHTEAEIGLGWAEKEFTQTVECSAINAEWKQMGMNIATGMFGLLRKRPT